jgi:hypothetical protein
MTPEIRLSTEEKEILLRWMRSSKTEQRLVERARVILLASSGLSGKEIALKMKTREARISKWLRRFAQDRIAGLSDSVTVESVAARVAQLVVIDIICAIIALRKKSQLDESTERITTELSLNRAKTGG